jgi:hypothetical protein
MITTILQLLTLLLTTTIYLKTKKIATLSNHQGINLINTAFLLFTLYYLISLTTTLISLPISKTAILLALTSPIQTYLLTAAALHLSASLFWKGTKHNSTPLHIIALLVVVISNFTNILTLTLITIYAYTTIIAYTNYQSKKTTFSQIYLIAIFLLLLSSITSHFSLPTAYSNAMTLTAFAVFLYGTMKK